MHELGMVWSISAVTETEFCLERLIKLWTLSRSVYTSLLADWIELVEASRSSSKRSYYNPHTCTPSYNNTHAVSTGIMPHQESIVGH